MRLDPSRYWVGKLAGLPRRYYCYLLEGRQLGRLDPIPILENRRRLRLGLLDGRETIPCSLAGLGGREVPARLGLVGGRRGCVWRMSLGRMLLGGGRREGRLLSGGEVGSRRGFVVVAAVIVWLVNDKVGCCCLGEKKNVRSAAFEG